MILVALIEHNHFLVVLTIWFSSETLKLHIRSYTTVIGWDNNGGVSELGKWLCRAVAALIYFLLN